MERETRGHSGRGDCAEARTSAEDQAIRLGFRVQIIEIDWSGKHAAAQRAVSCAEARTSAEDQAIRLGFRVQVIEIDWSGKHAAAQRAR